MDALIAIFSILYIFWPFIILFGIRELFSREYSFSTRIQRWCQRIFIGWIVWALFLGFIRWQGQKPILLFPENTNYLIFGLLGAITGGITIGWMFYRLWERRNRLSRAQSLDYLLAMPPDEFETLIADLFRSYGHDAHVSGGSSDHGVDVVINPNKVEKWIVQCKRYSGSVGEPVVRDLFGTMLHEGAQRAYLITTGSFTSQARLWAEGKPVVLFDGDALVALIRRTNKRIRKSQI